MTTHTAGTARKANGTVALEIILVTAIFLIAFAIRVVELEQLPPGMHGDEAASALVGLQMLRDWDFTPFTSVAAGMPTWPTLLYAISIELFGHGLFAIRVVSALEGALTVLVLYLLVRKYFDWKAATIAALLLATSEWHIHLTRVGFPLAGWPLIALIESWALFKAIERKSFAWWAISGYTVALGIYIYDTHYLLMAIFSLFVVLELLREKLSKHSMVASMVYGSFIVIASIPMATYAVNQPNTFSRHFSQASLTTTPDWQSQDAAGRIQLVAARYHDWWDHATLRYGDRDFIDELGTTPVLDFPVLILAGCGLIAAMKRRSTLTVLGLLVVLLMPLAPALTFGSGYARRTIPLLLFVMLFAGVGLAGIIDFFRTWKRGQLAVGALAAIVIAAIAVQNLDDYFIKFNAVANKEFLFARDHTAASEWMAKLPAGCFVEFSSQVRSFHYEITQFIAPEADGEDNSVEFGTGFTTLTDSSNGTPVWILLDAYRPKLDQVRQANSGGLTEVNGEPQNPLFVAYGFPPCMETVTKVTAR